MKVYYNSNFVNKSQRDRIKMIAAKDLKGTEPTTIDINEYRFWKVSTIISDMDVSDHQPEIYMKVVFKNFSKL